jgi:type I restriction enzyme S subunit
MSVPKLRFPEFRDSGEWEEKKLGEVATFYNGKAYKQEELLDQGKYRVLRVGNFFTNNNWYYSDLELDDTKYCDYGDLLYAWSASFAPRVWDGEKVIYHYHIWKVVEKKNIDKKFLFIILEHETERLKDQSANGLGLLHITKGTIEGWKCGFPTLPEQKKIADCLTSIADRITAESQKLDTLKAHKKGLMQQLFPTEGETLPKLRFPEFQDQDSGEWEEKKLGDITEKISDGIHSTPIYNENGQYYFVNGNNLAEDKIVMNESTKRVDEIEYLKYKTELSSQTILISINGTIGNLAFFNGEKVVLGKSACYINLKPNENKYFVFNLLKTSSIQQYFEKELTGSTIKNLSLSSIKNAKAFFPIPAEQEKIADCLTSIDEAIAAQSQAIDLLKLHKKGLMQQLFPSVEEVKG